MRVFQLLREVDSTGVSGTGIVAEGIQFSNGKVVLQWTTFHASICVYENIAEVETIHGHGGNTKIVWVDEQEKPKKRKKKESV